MFGLLQSTPLVVLVASACTAGSGAQPMDAIGNTDDAAVVDAPANNPDGHLPDPERGLSTGCGKAGGTGLQTRTIVVGGTTRSFLRFIPAGYTPNTAMSLVLAFHGSGGTSAGARSSFNLEAPANGKAIIVYPQGLQNNLGETRWDAIAADDPDNTFIDEIIRRTEEAYCIDRDRIFAAGFSNGARYTACLGCWRGDVLRAIAPLAPGGNATTLPFTGCVGEVGIWEGLGDQDADHVGGSTRVREYFTAANDCSATRTATTPTGCERYDGCRAEVPSVWCTYNLGHAWPSIGGTGVMGFFGSFQ
jgi:polyhydroxybutyrate depolymerase